MESNLNMNATDRLLSNDISHAAFSWRSVVAGLVVALFCFGLLTSLGLAIGGMSLENGAELQASGIMTGTWVLLSVLVSLLIASYVTSRASRFLSAKVGMMQGAVLSALFLGVVMSGGLSLTRMLVSTAGSAVMGAGQATAAAAPAASQFARSQSDMLRTMIEDRLNSIPGVHLKSDPVTIVNGLASRMMTGPEGSAKRYFSAQTGLSQERVDTELTRLNSEFEQATNAARVKAAQAMQLGGWSAFGLMLGSLLVSLIGGALGARFNERSSFAEARSSRTVTRPAHA